MDSFKRHQLVWKLLQPVISGVCARLYKLESLSQPLQEPCLIVSNHNTDFDPFLLAYTTRHFCYFIASEHIFHKKALGKLILWLVGPIARQKGSTAGDTAMTAIRRMRKGQAVAVFAEGNRSFNGQNSAIIESTAKLAKASGLPLATHRFRGGYLSSPRWAGAAIRRGKMTGEIVGIYPAAQLKKMSAEEIADLIRRDIHEDAYATQREWMIPYKGRRLAEHLERGFCLCPGCHAYGSLKTENDRLWCQSCGLEARYNVYGFLEGENFPFDNPLDWDKWQAKELQAMADNATDACLARDSEIRLSVVGEDHLEQTLAIGELALYKDRWELPNGERWLMEDIRGINISGPQSLEISADGKHYYIKSKEIRNLRKYISLYRAITDPENILAV